MSSEGNDENGDSRTTEGREEIMVDDATDATAPLDDAEGSSTAVDDVPSLSDEGSTTSSTAEESGHESQQDRSTRPEIMENGNTESPGDNSPVGGDADDSPANIAQEGASPTQDADGYTAKGEDQEEEEEKLIILPSYADDAIILPAKSKQTKAETIEGDDVNGDVVLAADNLEVSSEEKVTDGQSADSHGEKLIDNYPEDSNANENLSSASSESTRGESGDAKDETTMGKQDVYTEDQHLDDTDDSAPESETPDSVPATNNIEEEETASASIAEQEIGNAEIQNAEDDSSESAGEQSSSSRENNTDGSSSSTASSTEETELSGAESDNAHSIESSVESDGSNPSDPKTDVSSDANTTDSSISNSTNDSDIDGPRQIKLVDYASKVAGAIVLEQSPSLKGTSNLLTGDKDRYSIGPCEDKKYVVIGLSEDILVKQIKLSNYERYSSRVKEFQVLASQEYPTPNDSWNSIGKYEAKSKSGEQTFDLPEPLWARYLKFRFLSHYGSEHYCTLSQIKVHGSTMLQGFHEQWIESEKKEQELEKDHGDTAQEGGEKGEHPMGDEGTTHEEGTEPSQKKVEDTTHDTKESEDAEKEDLTAGESLSSMETSGQQREELQAAPAHDQDGEIETEAVSTQNEGGEGPNAITVDEPKQDKQDDVVISAESDKGEAAVNEEKSDGSKESPGEPDIDSQASGGSEGLDQNLSTESEEVHGERNESHAVDDDLVEDFTSTNDDFEHQQDASDAVKDIVDQSNSSQAELKDSIPKGEGGGEPIRNDSSIAAVTDVVKAAVADAYDALRTTVASAKTSETEKEDNATLEEERMPSDAEGELGSKKPQTSDTAEQDGSLTEPTSQSVNIQGLPKVEDGSIEKTVQEVAKPKAEESSPEAEESSPKAEENSHKAKDASSVATATESKPEKETPALKEDPKSATPGRDMLRRETITIAGKDSKDTDAASTGELYAKLSRRFPHASCMKDLDFQAFKSKTLLANAGGNGGNPVGGSAAKMKMEPIFAKITNEIKSVQVTQNQYEQYMSSLKACYETVIWDVAKDLDTMQASVDQQLSRLERAVFLSEMRAKGTNSPSYDRVAELFSGFPFAVSAFQFTTSPTMQEHSKFIGASVTVFLLLLWSLPRRKKSKRESGNEATDNSPTTTAPVTSPETNYASRLMNESEYPRPSAIQVPELTTVIELAENEDEGVSKELVDTSEKLSSLQEEHSSLQQRYSALEQTVSTIEKQMKQMAAAHDQKSNSDIKHVVFGGESFCSTPTPTPSVQSEPAASEQLCTTPSRPGRKIMGDSPLKNRFRKKKMMAKTKQ